PPGPPGAAISTGTPMPPAHTPRHPRAKGASLAYLPPLAITFATRQPVYPLKISRLGSPPVLCLRIVVLAPEGVWLTPPPGSTLAQEDLPVAVERMKTAQAQVQLAGLLGRGKRSEPRIFVDALRRKLAETADYRLLVCDARGPLEQIRLERTPERAYKVYSGPGASQQKTLDAVPLAAGRKLDTSRLYAARFWALLRREALDDLIFQCSPSPPSSAAMWSGRASEMPFVVKELASGYAIPTILAPYWFLAVPPVVMVCVLTVLIAGPMQRSLFGAISQESTPGQPSSARRGPGATAKAVLLFVALPAAALCGLASLVDSLGLVVAASWPLWLLGTLVAPGVIWWECREAELARGTVLAIAVAVATWVAAVLAAPAVGVDTYRYANWATLACASQLGLYSILAGLLSGAFTEPRRPIRAWPLAAYIAVLVGTAGAGLETRLAGPGYSGGYPPQDLQAGRQEILSALSAFAFDNGALPRNLKDLTSVGPITEGLDSSGNTVRVNLPGGRRPYLQKLPLDPLSGRRDSWTYEPTGDLVVDSGAWGLVALDTASLPAIPQGR
ncbi:MAG: hypothetical protein N2512_00145, partial [Armatimonadetes bacterium]|nr:hypothetical protein [Armatimonadota bacterium]